LKNLLILTTITSLDALAVGFGFSLLNVNFLRLSLVVPIVGAMGYLGLKAGGKLSQKFPNVMKKVAGVVLILIGVAQLL
jgi:putative Mn2+ efflux pump MntP